MTKRFSSGSKWRKWDLHVHVPGTKLNNAYSSKNGAPDWDRFADLLEESDVAVFGVTDYFSVELQLDFIEHFRRRYQQSEKLLLVNLELRLNETVNGAAEAVDFHVIFGDHVPPDKVREFVAKLKTQLTDGQGRHKPCTELGPNEYKAATVTRADIKGAFKDTFGEKSEPTDHLIYLAPASNNGLRAASKNQRKAYLADEIDKVVHAIFGKQEANKRYFLETNRFEDSSQHSKPKPVFGGCDAHSFEHLEQWLGKAVAAEDSHQVVTWVKADPTFAGLQQTLVEPRDRVSLSESEPDTKDSYKVISRVTFQGSSDFPSEIVFNPNLNAIIGSRSSGKSTLLAHIAHAVDPYYTVQQQMLATKSKESEAGPAAGLTWRDVQPTVCNVEWAGGSNSGGRVIYIPQNWLYRISDDPKEVTNKIQPVLQHQYGHYFREHKRQIEVAKTANETIGQAVDRWFELAQKIADLDVQSRDIGDKSSIVKECDAIGEQIEKLRSENALSAEDLDNYQAVVNEMGDKRARAAEAGIETEQLDPFLVVNGTGFAPAPGAVTVDIHMTPDLDDVPEKLAKILASLIEESKVALVTKAEADISTFRGSLAAEVKELTGAVSKLEADNKELIKKHQANSALENLVKRLQDQQSSVTRIERLEEQRSKAVDDQTAACQQVEDSRSVRDREISVLETSFKAEPRVLDQLQFGIVCGLDPDVTTELSERFNKNVKGPFSSETENGIDIQKAQSDPAGFLDSLFTKKQRLKSGHVPVDVARAVLMAMPEVRFTAELDGDKIGGFNRSTMTPGKQALFALTLILGETDDAWPLLIDQPEDDLDSRSVYNKIVSFLINQKKRRQIILVTHNANLVVGADAEAVLVANRHGDDRKNRDDHTFDYLTGSLEHSEHEPEAQYDLERMGVREHAVEILDGGVEAFQKRRDKYKI